MPPRLRSPSARRGKPRQSCTEEHSSPHDPYSYQSECGDHCPQERHWVSFHWRRHPGQTPPVSKVFQLWPQVHSQRSSRRGVQPHFGQRIFGPDGPTRSSLLTCSFTAGSLTPAPPFDWRAPRVREPGWRRRRSLRRPPCCSRRAIRRDDNAAASRRAERTGSSRLRPLRA